MWIVGKGTTTPCAEDESRVTVALSNGEYAMNAAL